MAGHVPPTSTWLLALPHGAMGISIPMLIAHLPTRKKQLEHGIEEKVRSSMLHFTAGLIIGCFAGVTMVALCMAAGKEKY